MCKRESGTSCVRNVSVKINMSNRIKLELIIKSILLTIDLILRWATDRLLSEATVISEVQGKSRSKLDLLNSESAMDKKNTHKQKKVSNKEKKVK